MTKMEKIREAFMSGWESLAYWGLMVGISIGNTLGGHEIDLQEIAIILGFGYIISAINSLRDGIQLKFHQKIDVTEYTNVKTEVEVEDETE